MGTKVAPTYANLFMDSIERKHIYTYRIPPKYWFRFIDNIWSIFEGTELELQEFLTHINSCHNSIKFTAEISKIAVTSLDIRTYVSNDRIKTTLHVKETDSHSYLQYDSCHPYATKSSIPFSQFLYIQWSIRYRKPRNIVDILVRSDLPIVTHFLGKKVISIPRCQ